MEASSRVRQTFISYPDTSGVNAKHLPESGICVPDPIEFLIHQP